MEKEKIEKLILKSVKEKKFEELTTNFEIINFITGEIIKDESFIINLRNELLKSKEDFNFNDPAERVLKRKRVGNVILLSFLFTPPSLAG